VYEDVDGRNAIVRFFSIYMQKIKKKLKINNINEKIVTTLMLLKHYIIIIIVVVVVVVDELMQSET